MTEAIEPPIRIFVSYAHADEVALEFIDPFVQSLKHLAFADQGRLLEVFVDRESIGWGEDWQEGIRSGIESATVFMPLITRQYFDRPACREELLAFYNEANRLGVTSLLLPVVILGHSYISLDSSDVAARIVAERQYRDLKEAWIDGQQSPTWRRVVVKLASELVAAAASAEQALAAPITSAIHEVESAKPEDDDAPGAAEVAEALELFQEETTQLFPTLQDTLTNFAAALSDPRLQNASPDEARRVLLEVAAHLRPISTEFQEKARGYETRTLETDRIMRDYVAFLKENNMTEQLQKERESLGETEEFLRPLTQGGEAISGFLKQIQPLEVASAPMRKSVRGFRDGARALSSALAIMQSWATIID